VYALFGLSGILELIYIHLKEKPLVTDGDQGTVDILPSSKKCLLPVSVPQFRREDPLLSN
jgi:hypothetical protein